MEVPDYSNDDSSSEDNYLDIIHGHESGADEYIDAETSNLDDRDDATSRSALFPRKFDDGVSATAVSVRLKSRTENKKNLMHSAPHIEANASSDGALYDIPDDSLYLEVSESAAVEVPSEYHAPADILPPRVTLPNSEESHNTPQSRISSAGQAPDFPPELAGWLVIEGGPLDAISPRWCHLRAGQFGSFCIFSEPGQRNPLKKFQLAELSSPKQNETSIDIGPCILRSESTSLSRVWHDLLRRAVLQAALADLGSAQNMHCCETQEPPTAQAGENASAASADFIGNYVNVDACRSLINANIDESVALLSADLTKNATSTNLTYNADFHVPVAETQVAISAKDRDALSSRVNEDSEGHDIEFQHEEEYLSHVWWYQPQMSRSEAESTIENWGRIPGAFVIRRSAKNAGEGQENFVLTLCTQTSIAHSVLVRDVKSGAVTPNLQNSQLKFASLSDVVRYFQRKQLVDGTTLLSYSP